MLGKASIYSKKKEDLSSYKEAFPELNFVDDGIPEEKKQDYEILHLWDKNKHIFDIYKIVRNYPINEFYSIDSAVLIALIKDKGYSVSECLELIPYAHSGYVEILIENRDKDG